MPLRPVFALLGNAFVYGTCWYAFREMDSAGLHALWATAIVYAILSVLVAITSPDALHELVSNPRFVPLVLFAGLTNASFNWGLVVGDVVRVVLLFYLMPVWAALAAHWILKERITRLTLLRVCAAIVGAMLVLYQPGMGAPIPTSAGDWLGLAGGLFFALNNVLLRRDARLSDATKTLAMFAGGMLIPCSLALVLTVSGGVTWPTAPANWLVVLAVLTIAFGAGNLWLVYGAAVLPANVTATILLSEILFAAVSAYWLAGEQIGIRTLLGGTLIVAAAAAAALQAGAEKPGHETSSLPG
jgi:drug/metabolite transporter (DMT)-like permease